MRSTYWMLGAITFSIFFGFLFLILPAIMVSFGFLVGAISIYFNYSPIIGEVIILIGTFFWRHFFLTLLIIIFITLGFLSFTDKVHKMGKYRKIKIKKKS